MKLYFPEIDFAAAHYIPKHEKCHVIHGHTYFVRNLTIEVDGFGLDNKGMSVDFGIIKGFFKKEWDHKFIVPDSDGSKWVEACKEIDPFMALAIRPLRYTTAEWMAVVIRRDLGKELGWDEATAAMNIHFELWEGPHQAVIV